MAGKKESRNKEDLGELEDEGGERRQYFGYFLFFSFYFFTLKLTCFACHSCWDGGKIEMEKNISEEQYRRVLALACGTALLV